MEPGDRALSGRRAYLLLGPLLLLIALAFVLPLVGMLGASLNAPNWSWQHYAHFLADPYYLGVLGRSMLLGLSVVGVTLLLGLPLAYWLARLQSRWVPALLLLATFPLWISAVVRSFGWVVLLARSGLLSTLVRDAGLADRSFQLLYTMGGVVLALSQVLLPFMLLSLYGVLRNISPELERAAQNLGCGPWRAAGLVTVPLAARGILSASLLVFALAVSAFATPSLVGGARVQLVSTTIYEQMTELADWPFAAAVAFILLAVVLAVTSLYTQVGSASAEVARR
ncbi:MAG: ABC transporter permease [Acetobacteraceae bacterium]|nr:ABC transporter permease [Acetobacteraceae bacterium]